jgi:cysteine desulfurase
VAGSAHLCIEGIENEALLFLLDQAGVCASAASACAAGAMEPSHVLHAMGVPRSLAQGSVRLTLGPTSTQDDIDHGAAVLVAAVHQLRRTSPASAARPT